MLASASALSRLGARRALGKRYAGSPIWWLSFDTRALSRAAGHDKVARTTGPALGAALAAPLAEVKTMKLLAAHRIEKTTHINLIFLQVSADGRDS
jgi:hypothetical protein